MDLVDAGPVNVAAPKDESGTDVSLVLEEPSFQQSTCGHDSRLRMGVHAQQFELAGDELRDHFRVGGGSGTAAVHVGCQVVDLFAILFGNLGSARRTGIGTENNSVLVDNTNNGGSGLLAGGKSLGSSQHHDVLVAEGVLEGKAGNGRATGKGTVSTGVFGHHGDQIYVV